jgi:hypothetical protein
MLLYQPQALPLVSMANPSLQYQQSDLSIETEPLMGNLGGNQQSFDKADTDLREDVEASPTNDVPTERIELTEKDVHYPSAPYLQSQGSP